MIELLISGNPVPWAAHKGFGRRAYNPRYKDRERVQWELREQYRDDPIKYAVCISYDFFMPVPASTSNKRRVMMLSENWHHCKKPDITNLVKFLEDCLKGIVIVDDSQVIKMQVTKTYSLIPRSRMVISLPAEFSLLPLDDKISNL